MTGEWHVAPLIAGATLVSEDLTCVAAGLLILNGQLDATVGVVACAVGILLGDLGLFGAGRLLRRGLTGWWSSQGSGAAGAQTVGRIDAAADPEQRGTLEASRVSAAWAHGRTWLSNAVSMRLHRSVTLEVLEGAASRLERRLGWAVLSSRVVPGTRLVMYLAAGALGRRPLAFVGWTAFSVCLWVPALVLSVATFGEALVTPLRTWFDLAWVAVPLVAVVAVGVPSKLLTRLSDKRLRQRVAAKVSLLWRWEFWPSWFFYLPLVPWLMGLALRHGGWRTIAAANPGFEEGGFVGESKFGILQLLPPDWTLQAELLAPGSVESRLDMFAAAMTTNGWTFPIIFKPDVGQRGSGVRLIRSTEQARAYLQAHPGAVITQRYHEGPHEAGVFYWRRPEEATGRIFSITHKTFPRVVGDGVSTISDLVWNHPRYRMQAARFHDRFGEAAFRVPEAGEVVRLGLAGDHAQGTLFQDGSHLWSPALEARIDAIAQRTPGFFVGRFDIRYGDVEAFRRGDDLGIVELNGVTSESTNIYDPDRSLFQAYQTLARQWRIIFEVGAANRARGHQGASASRLLARWLEHVRSSEPIPTSD